MLQCEFCASPLKKTAENLFVCKSCGHRYTFSQAQTLLKKSKRVGKETFRIENAVLKRYYGDAEEVVVPDGVTEIGIGAFHANTTLQKVVLPQGVSVIQASAFQGCTALCEISLPYGLHEIGSHAFENCSSLKEIHFPDSLCSLGNHSFAGCAVLQQIDLPDSVIRLDGGCFAGCTSLQSVKMSAGIKEIMGYAFQNCISLTELVIPDTAEQVGCYHDFGSDLVQSICDGCENLRVYLPKRFPDEVVRGCKVRCELPGETT